MNYTNVPLLDPASSGKKISPAMVPGGYIWDWELSSNGDRVVYSAYKDTFPILELYSVPAAGPASAGVKLNQDFVSDGGLFRYELSRDGQRVVYKADQEVDDKEELYCAPIVEPASAGVKLNEPLAGNGYVWGFDISSDYTRAIYTALDQGTSGPTAVFSAPIDGQTNAAKINRTPVVGGTAWKFEISPDGKQVAYRGDLDTVGTDELYAVSINGPASSGEKNQRTDG